MSLDVHLYGEAEDPEEQLRYEAAVRVKELAESGDASPATVPDLLLVSNWILDRGMPQRKSLFSANITHNLGEMAEAAGIYSHLWRPEEIGITKSRHLIEPLTAGVARLKSNPERFKALEPENKWGTYARFVPWIETYIEACREHPDADVYACR